MGSRVYSLSRYARNESNVGSGERFKNPNGWGLYRGNPTKAVCTAFALLALAEQKVPKEDISQVIAYLEEAQKIDGTWPDLIERHKGVSFHRFASPYCIMALVASGVTLSSPTMQRAFGWLLDSFKDGQVRYQDSDIITWSTRDCLLALASVHFNLEVRQIVEIIDQNFELRGKTSELQKTVENLKSKNVEQITQRDDYIKNVLNEKERKAAVNILILKTLAIIGPLLLLGSVMYLIVSNLGLKPSEIGVYSAAGLAIWSFYAKTVYDMKLH